MISRYIIITLIALNSNLAYCDSSNNKNEHYIEQFKSVLNIIDQKYVQKPNKQELVDGAIRGMLSSLDPYSSLFVDDDLEEFMKDIDGEFGGVGIQIYPDKTGLKIISPVDDLPAFKAGIKSGDIIIAIDDFDINNEFYEKSVKRIRGNVGSKVKLTIYRSGEKDLLEFVLTREIVKIHPVKVKLDKDIVYIRIPVFNKQTFSSLQTEMQKITKTNKSSIKGAILDLRNNPGGSLDQAVQVTSYFIDKGIIVTIKYRDENQNHVLVSEKLMQTFPLVPVIILINEGSASASEIVAGALQDHKRAIIIGTKSFGKGSVQEFIPINNRSAIKLTEAKFYSPNGKEIQGNGIIPDIIIEQQKIEYEKKEETILEKFTNNSRNQRKKLSITQEIKEKDKEKMSDWQDVDKTKSIKKPVEDRSEQYLSDYQYARAFDLIKGLNIVKAYK